MLWMRKIKVKGTTLYNVKILWQVFHGFNLIPEPAAGLNFYPYSGNRRLPE